MSRIKKIIYLLIAFPLSAMAQSVHEYHLPNGLQLWVKEDHRAPVIISQIWYKVGSSYENEGTTGISHALEHMMFRGTKAYGPGKFIKIISNNGGQLNAFTSYDHTAYYEILSADKLPISFKLEADRMRNLSLQPEAFNKEIQVVMEERRTRTDDNPQATTLERFNAAAFLASPYHHPVVGWMRDLKAMTMKDLQAWYQQWYAPNNAVVVVVGDVEPTKVYQLALRYFGSLPTALSPIMKPQTEVEPLGQRQVNVKIPAKLPYLMMGYQVPVIKTDLNSNDPYVLDVLNNLLGGTENSRLSQHLVRDQQIAAAIETEYEPLMRLDHLFVIQATPSRNHTLEQLEAAILAEIKTLQEKPISAAELERIKTQMIAEKIYKKDSFTEQALELGSLATVGLPWQLSDDYVKKIAAITPEQVQEVAKKYFVAERLTVATLNPLPINDKRETSHVPVISKAQLEN